MRFLHSADWHLGRSLGGFPLVECQAHLLHQQFLAMVEETRPDAVLLAGDIYDRSVPPAEAVELLDAILVDIVVRQRIPVLLIPGNHDCRDRLAFGAKMLSAAGLHIGDSPLGRVVTLHDAHGPVDLVGLGYCSPAFLASKLPDGREVEDHDAGFAALGPILHGACSAPRRVLVAHGLVAGGTVDAEERALTIGGAGAIGAARFAGFDYVALGHLHRRQTLGEGRLHYSGGPLALVPVEAEATKSATLVELDAAGGVRLEALDFTPRRALRRLRGTFEALIARPGCADYLAIALEDPLPVPNAQRRLAERFPHIVSVEHVALAVSLDASEGAASRDATPLALFEQFYAARRGQPLDPEQHAAVVAAIATAQAGDAA